VADKQREIEAMVDELFRAVQNHQGYFHISDGETFPTKRQLIKRIRGRLAHGRMAVQKMQAWLRKHDPEFFRT